VLKVYVGVVRLPDDRDFVILVDGESPLVEEAVIRVIREIWGDGDVKLLAEGLDFREFIHAGHENSSRPDGYVLQCEVGSPKRINFAIEYARRRKKLDTQEK
jgi:hypothetical protein